MGVCAPNSWQTRVSHGILMLVGDQDIIEVFPICELLAVASVFWKSPRRNARSAKASKQ